MARTSAPEGAKKLYFGEKVFMKIEKAMEAYDAALKLAKSRKDPEGAAAQKATASTAIAQAIAGNWEEIKLASGIKPPKVPALPKAVAGQKKVTSPFADGKKRIDPFAGSASTQRTDRNKTAIPAPAAKPGEV